MRQAGAIFSRPVQTLVRWWIASTCPELGVLLPRKLTEDSQPELTPSTAWATSASQCSPCGLPGDL